MTLSARAGQQQQIEWRRNKIIEMRARGMSQIEIARELQVSKQVISLDVIYLRNQAKASINEYLTEVLPEQYQLSLAALDEILRNTYDIMTHAHDNREKLQALELYKETHMTKLELLSDATTIDHALNYIKSKQKQQEREREQQQKQEEQTDAAETTIDSESVF